MVILCLLTNLLHTNFSESKTEECQKALSDIHRSHFSGTRSELLSKNCKENFQISNKNQVFDNKEAMKLLPE
jgi:hypothetical protein